MPERPPFDPKRKLAEALASRGLARSDLAREFRPGAVCSINDAAVALPTERLAGAGPRTRHDLRRAIIVQRQEWATSKSPPTLLIVPCSASHRGAVGTWDVTVPEDTPGFTKDRVVAYASLVQPVLKSDVNAIHGHVDAEFLHVLLTTLARLLDLTDVGPKA